MATQLKFHEKAVEAYFKLETTSGTYEAPTVTDIIPSTALDGSITDETGSFQYLGDPNSRDEYTYLKDTYAEFSQETNLQRLDTLDITRTAAEVPLYAPMTACGATVSVSGSTGVATIENAVISDETISINYVKTSAEDSINSKVYKFYGVRGMMDLTLNLGDLPKLKFNFKGNAYDPEQVPQVTANYGSQKINLIASVHPDRIVNAEITPYGENFNARTAISGTPSIAKSGTTATVTLNSHGLTTGRKVRVSGCTGTDGAFYNGDFIITKIDANSFEYTMQGTPASNAAGTIVVSKDGWKKPFCLGGLTANNFFGYDLARILTGCEQGYNKTAVPTDVSVSLLEGQATKYTVSGITKTTNVATATCNGHGLSVGDNITISGVTGTDSGIYNGTFPVSDVTDENTFKYVMSATPSADAAFTDRIIMINNTQDNFNPETERQNYFAIQIKIGTRAGAYATFQWDKVQLANIKDGVISTFKAKDCTFRNTGTTRIILS